MIDEHEVEDQPTALDWREDLDGELGQLVAQKGWRSARDVLSSYRNLERMVGGDRLTLPNRDAGPEAWAPIWDKLGRPKDSAGYDLAAPVQGTYDKAAADWFRDTAFGLGLSNDQARQLHDAFLARFPGTPTAPADLDEGLVSPDESETDLRDLWGRQYDRNMAAARRAFGAFMGDEAPFHEIADGLGETALMELLARVGNAIGEDSITARADAAGSGPRSPAEALSEIARLQRAAKADPKHPYVSKTHPDHATTVKRMEDLFAVAYGG
jgi:hypothetical protein